MTKKKKIFPEKKYEYHYQSLSFKVEETVHQPNKSMPSNLAEAKEKFLKSGKTPQFEVQDPAKLAELASKTKNQIRFELLGEAEYILEKVKEEYGEAEYFLQHMFGSRINKEEATPMLLSYIEENSLTESIKIHWCDNMPCSAKMVWTGPVVNANKPELRRYSLWINGSEDNNYMRDIGIKCLMDHELGTHFFRMVNDGFQPWFSERSRFGLRNLGGFEGQCTEEGLASINTALRGRVRLLWSAALAYYTACKAAEMTFKQLFDHIGRYISNPDARWKAVMRVKRGLADPNDFGGFGNDQCYFEGAVKILRNIDKIDFHLLMSGKVCFDELDRIKRVVRRNVIKVPVFMKNMSAYVKTLKKMAALNNLGEIYPHRSPPSAYLRRLDERRCETSGRKPKKVSSFNKLKDNSSNKEKLKQKHKESDTEEEIKSSNSSKFVNLHLQKKLYEEGKSKSLECDAKIANMVVDIKDQIKTLDSQLDLVAGISKFKDLIKGHSWSSLEYKDNIMKEAFGENSRIGEESGHELMEGCLSETPTSLEKSIEKQVNEIDATSETATENQFNQSPNFIENSTENYFKLEPTVEESKRLPQLQQLDKVVPSNIEVSLKQNNKRKHVETTNKLQSLAPVFGGIRCTSSLGHDLMCLSESNSKPVDKGSSLKSNNTLTRKKDLRSKSTNIPFSEEEKVSMRLDRSVSERFMKVPISTEEIFNYKRINKEIHKQKQPLYPSVACLKTRDNSTMQVDQVKHKHKIMKKVSKLNIGAVEERDLGVMPLLPRSDNLKETKTDLTKNNLFIQSNLDISEGELDKQINLCLKDLSNTDIRSMKAFCDAEQALGFQNAIPTSRPVSIHRKPRKQMTFKHTQRKCFDQTKPVPLYSDSTLAGFKIEGTKQGNAFIPLTGFKQGQKNYQTCHLLHQKNPSQRISTVRPSDMKTFCHPRLMSILKQKL